LYKFHIRSHHHAHVVDKADPYGIFHEKPPRTASVVWNLNYDWGDQEWMRTRGGRDSLNAPISIYEVHLGSWMRVPEEHNRPLTYRETAPRLAEYVQRMGFTHVEFLPVMEHPFYGSWGYQTTGYFAPTSRYGTPQDFMYLVDYLHQRDIGEILEAIDFLRQFNAEAYKEHGDIQTIAEESTAWPMVSRPIYVGGLGFGMKWDMGWMHDTLIYFSHDPIHRKFHHNLLTFRML